MPRVYAWNSLLGTSSAASCQCLRVSHFPLRFIFSFLYRLIVHHFFSYPSIVLKFCPKITAKLPLSCLPQVLKESNIFKTFYKKLF